MSLCYEVGELREKKGSRSQSTRRETREKMSDFLYVTTPELEAAAVPVRDNLLLNWSDKSNEWFTMGSRHAYNANHLGMWAINKTALSDWSVRCQRKSRRARAARRTALRLVREKFGSTRHTRAGSGILKAYKCLRAPSNSEPSSQTAPRIPSAGTKEFRN